MLLCGLGGGGNEQSRRCLQCTPTALRRVAPGGVASGEATGKVCVLQLTHDFLGVLRRLRLADPLDFLSYVGVCNSLSLLYTIQFPVAGTKTPPIPKYLGLGCLD